MHKWTQKILRKSLLVNRLEDKIYTFIEERAKRNKRDKENTNQNNLKHTDFYTNELHS